MIILVMGVSGAGKTTIGQQLAEVLDWQFYDADDFHPHENIEKLRRGLPLADRDRLPWLQALQSAIRQWLAEHKDIVLACSALKADYRQILNLDPNQVRFVYLKGSFELIQHRLQRRQGHFMNPTLLQSQFETLEEPRDAILVDIAQPPEAIVKQIITNL
jgi:gluconokinase